MTDENPYAPPREAREAVEAEHDLYGTGRVRGWLAFFCAVLVYINPLLFLLACWTEWDKTAPLFDSLPGLRATVVLELVLGAIVTAFGVFAGRRLHAMHRDAVKLAKKYLLANVVYTTLSGLIPFALVDMAPEGRRAVTDLATKNAGRGFVFFAIWFLYLTYSQQVKERFPRS